jgi:YidC/Oxa1 family membrane protein insertase
MNNQRLLIWATFGMLAWLTYQAWQADYGQPPAVETQEQTEEPTAPPGTIDSVPSLPEAAVDAPQFDEQTPSLDETQQPVGAVQESDSGIVRVTTDVLEIEISRTGATVQRAVIRKYPINKDEPDKLVQLLSPSGPDLGMIQTGLITGRALQSRKNSDSLVAVIASTSRSALLMRATLTGKERSMRKSCDGLTKSNARCSMSTRIHSTGRSFTMARNPKSSIEMI